MDESTFVGAKKKKKKKKMRIGSLKSVGKTISLYISPTSMWHNSVLRVPHSAHIPYEGK